MRRLLFGSALLMAVALAVVMISCERTPSNPDLAAPDVDTRGLAAAPLGPSQEDLEMLYNSLDNYPIDAVEIDVDPDNGDTYQFSFPTWPTGMVCELHVPGVITNLPPGCETLTITALQPPPDRTECPPATFAFEPDGATFDPPATMTLYYPHWLKQPEETVPKFCIVRTGSEPELDYQMRDFARLVPITDRGYIKVSFAIPHFSRWSLQDGYRECIEP